jgi:anti-anti-sigma regulatory factor
MGVPPLDSVTSTLSDHLCRAVDRPGQVVAEAVASLCAETPAGQTALVLAPPENEELAGSIADLAAEASVDAGGDLASVDVVPCATHAGFGTIDADATVERLEVAVAAALGSGRTGLRVVAVLAQAPTDPRVWSSLLAWEHALDRWRSTRAVTLTCLVDRTVLGDSRVHEFACLHQRVVTTGVPVPFQLYHRAGRLVLEGEIDTFSAPLLRRALAHLRPGTDARLVVDARGLAFVNHRGIQAIVDGLAARHPAGVTLAGAPAVPLRLLENMGIEPAVLDVLPSPW